MTMKFANTALAFTIAICLLGVVAYFISGEENLISSESIQEYLEPDMEITTIDVWSGKHPNRIRNERKGIYSADIDNDSIEEIIVFYTTKLLSDGTTPMDTTAGILVLRKTRKGYIKLWENKGHEAENSFDQVSGVKDINRDGKIDIVAMRWVGASAGASLDIYTWDGKTFKEIEGSWWSVHHVEFKDVDKDEIDEIIVSPRFDPPETYKWDGKKYALHK